MPQKSKNRSFSAKNAFETELNRHNVAIKQANKARYSLLPQHKFRFRPLLSISSPQVSCGEYRRVELILMHLHICAQRPNIALFVITTAFLRPIRGSASRTIVIALTTSFWQTVHFIGTTILSHSESSATDHVLVMLLSFQMTLKGLRTRPQCRTTMTIALNYESFLRTLISRR